MAATAAASSGGAGNDPPQQALGELWVGCAGYSYVHWRKGVFYPKGLKPERELHYYSQVFDTCEVNTSFYGTPGADTCAHWQQQVSKSNNGRFAFTLKMRQTVTHGGGDMHATGADGSSGSGSGSPSRGPSPSASSSPGPGRRLEPLSREALEAELPRFLERCEQLRTGRDGAFPPSLGVVLLQFPPSFEKSLEALERLARHLPGGSEAPPHIAVAAPPPGAYRFALEFRHRSWYCPEVYAFMRRQGWGLVQHALIHNLYPEKGIPEIDEVTAPFVYLRLHGKKAEHAWDYTEAELRPYCDKIVAWRRRGLHCWVYFLNDADGMAPKNAFDLLGMVRAACGEPAPARPEDAQRQMMARFFSSSAGGGGLGHGKRAAAEAAAAEATGSDGKGEGTTEGPTPPSPKRARPEKGDGQAAAAVAAAAATAPSSSPSPARTPAPPPSSGARKGKGAATPAATAAAAGTRPLTSFFKQKKE